jgi:ABC-type uncharacterized transport system substrate-binding protein
MLPAIKSFRSLMHVLLCLLALAPIPCRAENLKVLVVLSDNSAPYLSFATSFSKALAASGAGAVVTESQAISGSNADLIVAVGMKATELAATQTGTPVLAVMIPKMSYEDLLAQAPQKTTLAISAIYFNQPWDRRLDFLRAALPERRRIGLLYSPDTHIDVARLRQDIAQRGGSLVAQPVLFADELFSKLESVLASSDVLLAIPDSAIYSNNNIRNILLTSYRLNVPLIGLSQAYVNAGALCAIFSTPEQLAEQAGSTASSFARTGDLPEPQYPALFTIAVNQQVAKSLGIEIASTEVIRSRMVKEKEGKR